MKSKKETARLLATMADLMEFKGVNQFKVRAFRNGNQTLRRLEDDFEQLVKDRQLESVKGIGKGLVSVIYEFALEEKTTALDELMDGLHDAILELFSIKGLGPKKIRAMYDELSIDSINDLEAAIEKDELSSLKGFGAKTQQKILEEVRRYQRDKNYVLFSTAREYGQKIAAALDEIDSVKEYSPVGEYRRHSEIISRLEFIVWSDAPDKAISLLKKEFEKARKEKDHVLIELDMCDAAVFFCETKKEYIKELFLKTGSAEFIEKSGIDTGSIASEKEETIFTKENLDVVPPEMREELYFSQPEKLRKPSDLELSKFKGMFHWHTTASDGNNTLEEMAKAGQEYGYEYFAVCDHSKTASYAGGLKEDDIRSQTKELERLASDKGLHIYQGIESDILKDGSLDYDNEFLKELDFVVASVHSQFNLSEEEMTARIIKAVENEHTDVLGHPTGRLLLIRNAYQIDIKKVIDACAANDVAIEINANPQRLDLDWRNIYYAREKGCRFSINQDAHATQEIEYINIGIGIAKKGGLQTKEVINCLSEKDFITFINRKVNRGNRYGVS